MSSRILKEHHMAKETQGQPYVPPGLSSLESTSPPGVAPNVARNWMSVNHCQDYLILPGSVENSTDPLGNVDEETEGDAPIAQNDASNLSRPRSPFTDGLRADEHVSPAAPVYHQDPDKEVIYAADD